VPQSKLAALNYGKGSAQTYSRESMSNEGAGYRSGSLPQEEGKIKQFQATVL